MIEYVIFIQKMTQKNKQKIAVKLKNHYKPKNNKYKNSYICVSVNLFLVWEWQSHKLSLQNSLNSSQGQ